MWKLFRVIEANQCDVPLEVLLSVGRFDPSRLSDKEGQIVHDKPRLEHKQTFGTWTFESEESLSIELLRDMVKKHLPAGVYRCKGIVRTIEHPERRSILQCVGRRTEFPRQQAVRRQ